MAERKSGPVKPPVIDLKAREAAQTPAPQAAGDPPAGEAAPPEAPMPATTRPRTPRAAKVAAAATDAQAPASVEEARAAAEGIPLPGDAPPDALEEQPASPAPEPEPAPEPQPAPIPPPPRPPARLAMPWSAISIAAIAGALLGAGLTYLAANWIALPHQAPPFADPTPAIANLTDRLDELDMRLASTEESTRDARVSLDATLVQLDTTSAELRQSIATVEAAIPEPQPATDLSGIQSELQTLQGRVAAIAAGASSADASALAEDLVRIEQTLTALDTRLADFDARVGANDAGLAALRTEVADAKTAIAAQTRTLGGADIGPAVKLPLIVSGLEAAFANGRAYANELDGLTALLPDLVVPDVIAEHAATGLARPDALTARFAAILPDVLTGRTGESTGDWAQDAVEWAKALLALRPAEEMEGDTPEAIVSRLEGAVSRRDYIAAAALLAQLPAPMRQAAGEVGTDIAAHAQAETFVTRLRSEALAPAAEPAN